MKGTSLLRLGLHLVVGTLLSILVFFSISFLTYLADIDTFNPAASNELNVDIGFPFTYYAESFRGQSQIPVTWANSALLLADCAITWIVVALPYFLYKFSKGKGYLRKSEDDILDQQQNLPN